MPDLDLDAIERRAAALASVPLLDLEADGRLVLRITQDIPALVDEVRRLRQELDDLEAAGLIVR